ncbi:MAG: hypothetical protein ACT6FF_06225 [Methanosarcinaceae archaeon]
MFNINKYFALGLTLLLVMAAAFSMGCTETSPEGSADEVSIVDDGIIITYKNIHQRHCK